MKLVRSSGTKLELQLEKLLRASGIRYQKQPNLVGKPDFRVKNSNVLIFCDSSFWHGRRKNELNGKAFGKNRSFWVAKLQENKKRDVRINRLLRSTGWRVVRFWDTDILKFPEKVKSKLLKTVGKNA